MHNTFFCDSISIVFEYWSWLCTSYEKYSEDKENIWPPFFSALYTLTLAFPEGKKFRSLGLYII